MKQEEERILNANQEEKALRLGKERAKEGKERKEKEEREEQERLSKLVDQTRLRLEEEAAAKAKAEQLGDGKDVDTETSKSIEDGKNNPEDGLRIDTTSISSSTSDKRRSQQPQMHQPIWYLVRGVSGESAKDIAGSTDIFEKSMTIHLAEDPATTSRNHAIRLLQEQEDGLMTDQKIAIISCFMEDVVTANTYISLTDPEVRQAWIFMMLMK